MATKGLTKSSKIRFPIIFNDGALSRLIDMAADLGWKCRSIDLYMKDGSRLEECTSSDLQKIDETYWNNLERIEFTFDSSADDGSATITFGSLAGSKILDGRVEYMVRGSEAGSVLAFETRLVEYFKTIKTWHWHLGDLLFWLIPLWILASLWAKLFDRYRAGPLNHHALVELGAIGLATVILLMLLLFRHALFPKIAVAVGTGASQHHQTKIRRQKIGAIAYDVIKVLAGAILGAMFQAYVSGRH